MEPALAAQFPEIQTYRGQGLDDPTATVRFDWTPAASTPWSSRRAARCTSTRGRRATPRTTSRYFKRDYARAAATRFRCVVGRAAETTPAPRSDGGRPRAAGAVGDTLRTYRLALAATGEYTAVPRRHRSRGRAMAGDRHHHEPRERHLRARPGGAHDAGREQRRRSSTRTPSTDPYTNNDGGAMLGQNQTNLDTVIGTANYDIGHVFSTGGGGVAGLGVVCSAGSKARGRHRASRDPIGDAFDVDYVAHEMGHQFGGNHTFNGTTGSCARQPLRRTRPTSRAAARRSWRTPASAAPRTCSRTATTTSTRSSLRDVGLPGRGRRRAAARPAPPATRRPAVDAGADFTIPAARRSRSPPRQRSQRRRPHLRLGGVRPRAPPRRPTRTTAPADLPLVRPDDEPVAHVPELSDILNERRHATASRCPPRRAR